MRVYIAGPYTLGDVALNIRQVLVVAEAIFEAGHTPFVPHLYHFWHLINPKPYDYWIKLDMEWLKICDALIRLDGKSSGADREVDWCRSNGVPVFNSLEDFFKVISVSLDK